MTCIVGVVKKGVVYMGGDSCASGRSWQTLTDSKVFILGEVMLGVSGSLRHLDLLKFAWPGASVNEANTDPERFLRTTFASSVWDTMEKYRQNVDGTLDNSSFLIGFRGKLYEFQSDYSILSAPDWGTAIGSGDDPARGSLFTTRNMKLTPEARVKIALEAAEAVSPGVRAPFNTIKLGPVRPVRLRARKVN